MLNTTCRFAALTLTLAALLTSTPALQADERPAGDEVMTSITTAVEALSTAPDGDRFALLPAGTQVERVAWRQTILHVWLTLPEYAAEWTTSPADVERIQAALAGGLLVDDAIGGLHVHVRRASDAAHTDLMEFTPRVPQPAPAPPADDVAGGESPAPRGPAQPCSRGVRQPSGALTGVVVYCAAGHGWTAGDSSWYLQRPVGWDMVEDYGNIDQLNAFAQAAFNAGATVVPMRPVGWQPVEVVLDEDDPGVTYTGDWADSTYFKHYENGVTVDGVSYKFASAAASETSVARYTPALPDDGFYPVYCFAAASTNRVCQTYRVRHSGGLSEVIVNHREVGNGWVWLGNYHFEAAGPAYVEISNASPDVGVVIADAIRWGGGMGTSVRPGPGHTSGYPRDEEAQRYWAEVELGDNAAGFDSGIWDLPGSDDGSDNVGTGARVAREMNQVPSGGVLVERWKRIYLEFHTNAATGDARGQLCLITTSGATTYQEEFAEKLSDEVDADLLLIDDTFEHAWIDRLSSTYTSGYGAISTGNNSDEFDATIVELAFHDNQLDAELLRDPRVRAAMGRACVHGIIRFLNGLPGSEVPLAFPPATPQEFAVADLGGGDVQLSWAPPLSGDAHGDPATEYVIYQSTNGYGFGDPIVVGDVLSHTLGGLPAGATMYVRVAARNAGGESPPTEVLAVRRAADGSVGDVLIVNGYDRLRRQINAQQTFTQPPFYAGDTIERQIPRRSNARDYVVQHAAALAAGDAGFASCANEAITSGQILLSGYSVVDWLLGTESVEDATFSSTEQTLVTDFLNAGGKLFCTGSELGYDLLGQGNGPAFMQDVLRCGYLGNDAGTFDLDGASASIFDDLGPLSFDPSAGAPYDVRSPDQLDTQSDSIACLDYVGGGGGIAGIQHTNETYNTVVFGVPFETIGSAADRAVIMARVLSYLRTASGPLPFDRDGDYDVDLDDYALFVFCFAGPGLEYNASHPCRLMDGDGDADVDLADFAQMQTVFTGPLVP
jgi:hypothetical protein